jgi:hypothetical protein
MTDRAGLQKLVVHLIGVSFFGNRAYEADFRCCGRRGQFPVRCLSPIYAGG